MIDKGDNVSPKAGLPSLVSRESGVVPGGSRPQIRDRLTKRLLHFLIQRRFLPRWNWLYQQAVNLLWQPAAPRDPELVTGWIEIGSASPQAIADFRHWWDKMPPSIVFPKDET